MNAEPQHLIFGTGAIGLATLDALRRRGETARLVNRSGTAPVPDDIEVLGGDASDPAFTTAAAGIGVDRQYAVFGAFGAITFMALSGVLLDRLRAATAVAPSPQHAPPTATA